MKLPQGFSLKRNADLPLPRAADTEKENPSRYKREDGSLVVRGVLATTNPVRHWVRGVGNAAIQLRIDAGTVSRWAEKGITSLPLARDHGMTGGFFSTPKVEDRLGRIENLAVEGDQIVGDWVFDPELARDLLGPIERGNLRETSAQFRIDQLTLLKESDNEPPLYQAEWTPLEGSLVWASADVRSHLRGKEMDPEQLQDMITQAVNKAVSAAVPTIVETVRGTISSTTEQPGANNPPANQTRAASVDSTPAPAPAKPNDGVAAKQFEIAVKNLGEKRAMELWSQSPDKFGDAVLAEMAKDTSPTPAMRNAGSIQAGLPADARVLRDLVTVTLARGLQGPGNEDLAKEAESVSRDWRDMAPMFFLNQLADAVGVRGNSPRPMALVKELFEVSRSRSMQAQTTVDGGARYYRDASGLVPADLPASFRDINRRTLERGYTRHVIPFQRVAKIKDVPDFRPATMIHLDIAGRFNALAAEQQLHELVAREQEGKFRALPYGHHHQVTYVAIVNDLLDTLVRIPALIGDFYAGGENKVFASVVIAGSVEGSPAYNLGSTLLQVNPIDFKRDILLVEKRALETIPIPPKAGQDPTYEYHYTEALVPTVAIFGKTLWNSWYEFMAERNRRTFDTPANTIRQPVFEQLWNNSVRSLYIPNKNIVLYPGPESTFCPVTVGRVVGQGLRVETAETGPKEQDGLIISVQSTFGVQMTHTRYAYKIEDQSA